MKVNIPLGVGSEVVGEGLVLSLDQCHDTTILTSGVSGKILICPGFVGEEFFLKASFLGVAGVVVPSIHYKDLAKLESLAGLTVLVLKRFGDFDLAFDEQEGLSKLNKKNLKIVKGERNSYVLEINA